MLVLALLLSSLSVCVNYGSEAVLSSALGPSLTAVTLASEVTSFDGYVRTGAQGMLRGVRRSVRRALRMMTYSVATWFEWLRRALKFIVLAAIVALAEGKLLSTWRLEGWRSVRIDLPLMLYVYGCLLIDERVPFRSRMLVILAIAHGVVPRDLIPDRSVFPGLLDDIVFIVFAVHLFRRSCRQSVTDYWARRAVDWRTRVIALRRA
jgi:uncharacterized membrane protein YkvA (DUF1232 family)